MAYQTWLGYYHGNVRRLKWDKNDLVEHANVFAKGCLLLREPPTLFASTVGRMGLKGIPGLRIEGKASVKKSGNKKRRRR